MHIVSINQKGQMTIPAPIRRKLEIKPGRRMVVEEDTGTIEARPVVDFFSLKGSIKTKRRFTQQTIKQEEKAAEMQAVREYLKNENS